MQNGNKIYKKVYKTNVRLKTVLISVLAVLLVCIMVMVGIFISFQKYIVYTSNGLYLDVPWLSEEAPADNQEPSQQ